MITLDNKYRKLKQLMQAEHIGALQLFLGYHKDLIVQKLERTRLNGSDLLVEQGRLKMLEDINSAFTDLDSKAKLEGQLNKEK